MKVEDFSRVSASPKRLRILKAISESDFIGYNRLSAITNINTSELYKHLKTLEAFDLIEGRESKYVMTEYGKEFMVFLKTRIDFGGETGDRESRDSG